MSKVLIAQFSAMMICLVVGCTAGSVEESRSSEPGVSRQSGEQIAAVPITVSRETTYLTEPLDAEGYLDYVAALNRSMSQGATPQNNAAVLLWTAVGPGPIDASIRDQFYRLLGISPLPESGDYLVPLEEFALGPARPGPRQVGSGARKKQLDELRDDVNEATKRPWPRDEFPVLAAWLDANASPARLVVQATQRPKFYLPLLPTDIPPVISLSIAHGEPCREAAKLLALRAMLRLNERDVDGAWEDLLSCHRLGRMVGRGPTLTEGLFGIAICQIASTSTAAFAALPEVDADHAARALADLRALPSPLAMAERFAGCERFLLLDAVTAVARHGSPALTKLSGEQDTADTPLPLSMFRANCDWNVPLRMINLHFDRMSELARLPDHRDRVSSLSQLENKLRSRAEDKGNLVRVLASSLVGAASREVAGERAGDIFLVLMAPSGSMFVTAEDRSTMHLRLCETALALAAYHGERGSYPSRLLELTPNYLPVTPKDLFTGSEPRYHCDGDGYELYSVGPNLKDDGARALGEAPLSDDLVVRTPRQSPN